MPVVLCYGKFTGMEKPKVVFRVDGGSEIGMGHIARCVRLARAIAEKIPIQIIFVTKTPKEVITSLINFPFNYDVENFEKKDSKSIVKFYEDNNPKVVVTDLSAIDNLGEYVRGVEKVPLHVNLGENFFNYFPFGIVVFPSVYKARAKCSCESKADYLVGEKYILIDPRLREIPMPDFKNKPFKILVTLGGADPRGWTSRVISLAKESKIKSEEASINVVIGFANKYRDQILTKSQECSFITVVDAPNDLMQMIASCDLAITSGGTTAYETIAAGRPTWVIPENEFEEEVAKILKSKNIIIGYGIAKLEEEFFGKIDKYRENNDWLINMAKIGRKFIDGKGLIRVTDKIVSFLS